MTNCTPDALATEERIVWLIPTDDIDYVREGFYGTTCRRGRVRPLAGRGSIVVGYAELAKSPHRGRTFYTRRVFWLAPHDRHLDPEGVYAKGSPCEAVDPRTVAPGVPGELTDRAWGAPVEDWV